MNVVITYQTGKPFENHLRMRLRLTQLPFPHHLRLMDLILSTYPLLQQRHPLRVRIPADTDDAVKVQGKTGIVDDKPTPQQHTLTKPSNMYPPIGYTVLLKCHTAMCCAFLLQQRHPLSLDISTAADDAVKVYATDYACAQDRGVLRDPLDILPAEFFSV